MLPIITVTVNPCIDISAHIPVLQPDRKLHCSGFKKEPGGGGINVSRVIERLGGNTTAMYLAGGYTGFYLTSMLISEHVNTVRIGTANHTRENFVVSEDTTCCQFRFGMPGPLIHEEEWQRCLHELSLIRDAGFIVAGGSLSEGVPSDFFARIAKIANDKGVKFVLDAAGLPLKEALKERLFMIKPNLGELAGLTGIKELTKETAISAAQSIIAKKQCEVIVVSLGAAGALLITDTLAEYMPAPVSKVKSTVGAGDSMVAGIVFSLSKGHSIIDSVRYGIACGTAATINDGTSLCEVADVDRLFSSLSNDAKATH